MEPGFDLPPPEGSTALGFGVDYDCMNTRRGLSRLFIVFVVFWYILGAFLLYGLWSESLSLDNSRRRTATAELDTCLEGVKAASKEDPVGMIRVDPSGRVLDRDNKVVPTEEGCRADYDSSLAGINAWNTFDRYCLTAFILLVPAFVYLFGRVTLWIIDGFKG